MQAVTLWPLASVLGLLVGSFLNVVAWRWYRSSLPRPLALQTRSQCPQCGTVLGWVELIPLVSFLVQRGRCRSCSARISWRYPLVEVVLAAVFGLITAVYGPHLQTLFLLCLAAILFTIALIDLETQLIPDQLTMLGAVVAGLGVWLLGQGSVVSTSAHWFAYGLSGALVGAGILGAIVLGTRGRGMGIGDIKLAAVLGLSLGGPLTLLALFTGFVSGALVGLGLLARGRASMKTAVPFGPFLVFGWLVAVLWGAQILAWYTGM